MRVLAGLMLVAAAGCLSPQVNTVIRGATPYAEEGAPDHLALAAQCLDRGDDAGALPHLSAHVAAHPDAVMIRAYLAELLVRIRRDPDARPQFERVIAEAQQATGQVRGHLVHCHTRLMEIAERSGDRYTEQLHRGIGLWLLVQRWDADQDRHDEAAVERTLAKAAAALRAARDERTGDARANLYLADVYERLGQPSAARSARRAARANLPDLSLTTAERDRLQDRSDFASR